VAIVLTSLALALFVVFLLIIPLPPRPPLFPYTTLFRSLWIAHEVAHAVRYTSPTSRADLKRLVTDLRGYYDYWDTGSRAGRSPRSEEHTSELQSRGHLVCRLLLEKKKKLNKTDVGCHEQ